MSGLEDLGAVAASVQLTGNCFRVMSRLVLCSDQLIGAIRKDCLTIHDEINFLILDLPDHSRQAAQELADRVQMIRHQIEKQDRDNASKAFRLLSVVAGFEQINNFIQYPANQHSDFLNEVDDSILVAADLENQPMAAFDSPLRSR